MNRINRTRGQVSSGKVCPPPSPSHPRHSDSRLIIRWAWDIGCPGEAQSVGNVGFYFFKAPPAAPCRVQRATVVRHSGNNDSATIEPRYSPITLTLTWLNYRLAGMPCLHARPILIAAAVGLYLDSVQGSAERAGLRRAEPSRAAGLTARGRGMEGAVLCGAASLFLNNRRNGAFTERTRNSGPRPD